ncbi:ABC-three component system protein [Nesterenkonia aurantiaca]|uniref:ABC-three component system protein n=1 Tax=Nesterenkonia aurantiaca TaxID=1436010 RepID=UPI003EE4ADF6
MQTSAYMPWYQAQFEREFLRRTGTEFENFATRVLATYHPGFLNPRPTGRLGDFGCDGLTYSGDISYACFGYLQGRGERELVKKIHSDFQRAASKWPSFTTWRFVTNAGAGPLATQAVLDLRETHKSTATRPIRIELWTENEMWKECGSKLQFEQLDELFPGVPEAADVSLSEITPLLKQLESSSIPIDTGAQIKPVPFLKMDFNSIDPANRYEFQVGREHANRIEAWYSQQVDPTQRDRHSRRFREIYDRATTNGDDVVESLYIALAGANLRLRPERANAAYAITAYFFDECDIFETPPPGWTPA